MTGRRSTGSPRTPAALLHLTVPERARSRASSSPSCSASPATLSGWAPSALDLGAQSVFLYCFRERELILDIFELCSGVRMMTSYIMPGGLQADLPPDFDERCARS